VNDFVILNYLANKLKVMAVKGAKVEKHSVSEQPHELKYEAKKEGTTPKKVEAAKKQLGQTSAKRWKRSLINK
jgi:hypothetical protein